VDSNEVPSIPQAEAGQRACAAFQSVFENGRKIELDHYIVYFAREPDNLVSLSLCSALQPDRVVLIPVCP
jgi:hypothetical protein